MAKGRFCCYLWIRLETPESRLGILHGVTLRHRSSARFNGMFGGRSGMYQNAIGGGPPAVGPRYPFSPPGAQSSAPGPSTQKKKNNPTMKHLLAHPHSR